MKDPYQRRRSQGMPFKCHDNGKRDSGATSNSNRHVTSENIGADQEDEDICMPGVGEDAFEP